MAIPRHQRRSAARRLEYYCDQNGINLVTVRCSTTRAARQNLDRQSRRDFPRDRRPTSSTGSISCRRSLDGPSSSPRPKGERSIIDELDCHHRPHQPKQPQLQSPVQEALPLPSEDNYDLTSAELRYARNYKTLRVGVLTDRPPLQSFDPETGEFKGVTKGILEYLSVAHGAIVRNGEHTARMTIWPLRCARRTSTSLPA